MEKFYAMKTVLFVCYGGGHAKTLIPIVREFQTNYPNVRTVVFGATNAAIDLKNAGIEPLTYCDIIPDGQRELIMGLGKQILAENHNSTGGVSECASLAYLGMNLADLNDSCGSWEANRLYKRFGRRAFLPLGSMRHLLDQIRPDLVVTTSSPRTEQAARQVAIARDLPVLVVADVPDTYDRNGFLNVECTTLCLPSEFALARWSTKVWVKAKQMRVTGNPVFDRLLPFQRRRRAMAPDPPRLVFAQQTGRRALNQNQWMSFDRDDYWQHFKKWSEIALRLDVEAHVRLHPSIDKSIFYRWREACGTTNLILDSCKDLADSLERTSVLIGNFSTVLTEALIVGTPVVQYQYSTELPLLDGLSEAQATWSAPFDNIAAFANVVKKAISDHEVNATMRKNFDILYPSPPATKRVCDEIRKLM